MMIDSGDETRSHTVLITGGSGGIGRALCLEFAHAGWQVGVHYLDRKAEAERTVSLIIQDGGTSTTYQADIREAAQVDAMINTFVATNGRLDVMICNAGISSSRLLLRLSTEEWENLIATNLSGTFHCLQAAGRHMLEQRYGTIIVVGSYAGVHGDVGQSAYAASKAGLLGLVKASALEWGTYNIRVNAVLPGWHQTGLVSAAMPDKPELENHVLGRTPCLEEVAQSIFHLATAQDISGQVWNLDSRLL
ncbi:MAG TPA: SDR family NAD(P)-dependent oxidoreductase [Nitrospiraceae bacterium]|jgi:3-oxoacyl-[acyl-carrier protein] reductase|nr:SDR family NAD(P)-dependent oxidoreductase [Nitrospiraceae bacterium]